MRTLPFPELKDPEVYNEFEPWMIGQIVEVGLYEKKDEDGDYGDRRYQIAGLLEAFGHSLDLYSVKVMNRDAVNWRKSDGLILLISVVEPLD